MLYFSASELAFYDTDFFPYDLPDDAVEIDRQKYEEIIVGQESGKVVSSDNKGQPILADPPAPTTDQLTATAIRDRDTLLSVAMLRIAPLQDAADLGDASDAELAKLKLWKEYRRDLGRVQDQEGFPQDIIWPKNPE